MGFSASFVRSCVTLIRCVGVCPINPFSLDSMDLVFFCGSRLLVNCRMIGRELQYDC